MIRIHALGGLSVRGADEKPVSGAAAQPRRMAILALLARSGARGMTREKILALLWPDADDERGPRALAQALYALRKDLGADEAITGSGLLCLDPALVSSDVAEFASAIARGDDARAVALYDGPFLDGFHLSGAGEFSRWVERERAALINDYVRALESLARADLAQGLAQQAASRWRKLAAVEPLNARFTIGLMEALVAAGDRAGAIKQAQVYELLVEQELDLPADREVMAYAERLRNGAPATAPAPLTTNSRSTERVIETASAVPETSDTADRFPPDSGAQNAVAPASPEPARPTERRANRRPYVLLAAAAAISIGVTTYAIVSRLSDGARDDDAEAVTAPNAPVVAIGRIVAYGYDSTATAVAGPASELLATSLARVPGLSVVSHGRILELIRIGSASPDTSAGGFVNAARRAGARELIDGTVYARPGGRLRLDLRRVDLASGAIGDVHTVEGNDLFTLVDSGTARLVASFGARVPSGSVADVTTHSAVAYRLYVEGLRTLVRGDVRAAERLFGAALDEDSTFAMAAYYHGRVAPRRDELVSRLARALRLSTRATDRERLLIRAGWAWLVSSPELTAVAESLVTRYPEQTEGYLYAGMARLQEGAFLASIPILHRAVAMDSLSFSQPDMPWGCTACTAMSQIIAAYLAADSLAAAEREARRYTRMQPMVAAPWIALWDVLERAGRFAEADDVAGRIGSLDRDAAAALDRAAYHAIRMGRFDVADQVLRTGLATGNAAARRNALWALGISLRYQGRIADAVDIARAFRADSGGEDAAAVPSPDARPLAVALFESGRHREAAALFDSIAEWRPPDEVESGAARSRAWDLTHAARALAAAGDTTQLAARADTIAAIGAQSVSGRDRRLHHYVRGLLLSARNDLAGAEREFREAIYSPTIGYTGANCELAKVLLRAGRPREAVAVVQPAFRGKLDASNFYVTHTELHDLLGEAWAAAGRADSAAAHFAIVAHAWGAGDAGFRARAASARTRVAMLQQVDATH